MKSIKNFKHINAATIDEAVASLRRYGDKARIISGGSDLIGTLRFEVLHDYPEAVVNLKTIPGLDYIREEDGQLKIGALTRLRDIAVDPVVQSRYTALAEAAHKVASPAVREMGTIAGNICQLIRCWYFRAEENIFDCLRKGGRQCYAAVGDNRYHSIFGGTRVCAAPCTAGCPAGNEIPSYLERLRGGKTLEAAKMLAETNPLAAITGRVCPQACEKDCNRGELDEAVSIRSIERYVGDWMLEHAEEVYGKAANENGKEVAVIGSGPAGLTAAYYLRKLGYGVTVYEAEAEGGGVLRYGIPGYRLEKGVVKKQVEAIGKTGVKFKYGIRVGRDIRLEELKQRYEAVFCGTGAWKGPRLGLEGEDGVRFGLEYLKGVQEGKREMGGKKVVVIGGGSVAVDVAQTALREGAAEVWLVCLEKEGEMPARQEEVEEAKEEGVKVLASWGPSRVKIEGGQVKGIELVRCVRVYDGEHRFAPEYEVGTIEEVLAEEVILAIGQKAEVGYAEGMVKVSRGQIEIDGETQRTSEEGIYAGGDATQSGALSVAGAIGGGRRAAEAIHRYLGGPGGLKKEKEIEHLKRSEGWSQGRRVKEGKAVGELRLEREDVKGLDGEAVNSEAGRCLNCGCDGVNPSDVAAALVALEARIVTTRRTIAVEDFWAADRGLNPTVLEEDEIVTEIQVPEPEAGMKSAFIKFALRKSIDFPIVNCAAAVKMENGRVQSARVCLNGVYGNPYRAYKAEEAMQGREITEEAAEAAGAAAVSDAIALPYNRYKIQIARTMVKRAILGCR